MKTIKSQDTHYGVVSIIQNEDSPDKYFVKSGESFVCPAFSTVGYQKKPHELSKEEAEHCFEKAIYDSDWVYEATRGKSNGS